jgi:hypothetical protein
MPPNPSPTPLDGHRRIPSARPVASYNPQVLDQIKLVDRYRTLGDLEPSACHHAHRRSTIAAESPQDLMLDVNRLTQLLSCGMLCLTQPTWVALCVV